MQMTAADIAYMKGEAAVQPGDSAANVLARAAECGYLVPGVQRDAFVSGFISNCTADLAGQAQAGLGRGD